MPVETVRVGVVGCASIAERAMLPALGACAGLRLVAVASRTAAKAQSFAERFGCAAVTGYGELLRRDDLDAVYMPLPTGLHEEWVSAALDAGKHVLVEKSFAMNLASARRMLALARARNRVVVENFMFPHHSQHAWVCDTLASGALGELHLVRATFGFPPLAPGNFRYDKALGGGALLDTGAYIAKLAQLFLGEDVAVLGASRTMDPQRGVDLYGEATFRNPRGRVAQGAFGFDYFYQCRYELLGTQGKLSVERAFTAPPGLQPTVRIEQPNRNEVIALPADNHYVKMWQAFAQAVRDPAGYAREWAALERQAALLEAMAKGNES